MQHIHATSVAEQMWTASGVAPHWAAALPFSSASHPCCVEQAEESHRSVTDPKGFQQAPGDGTPAALLWWVGFGTFH